MMGRRRQGAGTVWQGKDGKWRGSFEAGYTARGGRRRITVTASTKRGCEKRLHDRMQEVRMGASAAPRTGNLDVKGWIEVWLKDRAELVRPKTYKAESGPLWKYIVPTIGQVKLKDLSTDHIRQVRDKMAAAGCSTTTIRYAQRIFQQTLKEAVEEGKTVPEGVILMKKPPAASSTRTAIPVDDAIKLVNQAGQNEDGQDGSRWVAALLQGMRQGECLGLRWSDVDFDSHTITIARQLQEIGYADRELRTFNIPPGMDAEHLEGTYFLTPTKSAAGVRVIPMVGPMEVMLKAWRDRAPENPHGLVWPNVRTGGPENKATDLRGWKRLQDAAGVSKGGGHYVLHEARNTTASLLLAAKVDPFIITQILGHTSITTSQGYMAVSQDQKRAALESVSHLLGM